MRNKILSYAALAFVLFFVLTNPAGAAGSAKHIGAGMARAATSVGAFFSALTGGGQ